MRSRLSLLVAAVVAAGLFAGCAEEREPINRVQPNALPKSFFIGQDFKDSSDDPEFYTRIQVVDVGYGAAQDGLFTSSWANAEMSRVKFVVQENELIARLAYERVSGSDGKGVGPAANDGVIVAIFRIQSHFDIKRDYNSSTGEELNVVGENSSDRPWYEREYIRVDFSQNLNTDAYDFDTLSLIGVYGGVQYESFAYYVNDPNSEDAPVFDEATGYFDVTTKAFAKPQLIDLSYLGWGIDKFPACYLDADVGGGSAPAATCNPVELTLRHSFKRVVPTDFEPKEWDGLRFKSYGGFYKERYGFARNYGMSDDKWHRLLSHYNIWERSHYYTDPAKMEGAIECYTSATTGRGEDPHRDIDGNGTEDECEAVTAATGFGGSRCDTFNQKCTLPLRARTAKPIVWYVTTGSLPEAHEGTEYATQDWDIAIRASVAAGLNAECKATSDRAACAAKVLALSSTLKAVGASCSANEECASGSCGCTGTTSDCGSAPKVCRPCTDIYPDDAKSCDEKYPIFKGQMDDIWQLTLLSREVDDCRAGRSYVGEDCDAVANDLAATRNVDSGVTAVAKMPEMVILCHSPVEANDHQACGGPRLPASLSAEKCFQARVNKDSATLAQCAQALNVRIGDLRYHTVNNIAAPQDPSAWGIMVDSNDPLTGETVSSSINVWTYITDLWTQGVIDRARVIKGELSIPEVTEGQNIKDWSTAASGGGSTGAVQGMTAADMQGVVAAAVGKDVASYTQAKATRRLPPQIQQKINKKTREFTASVKAAHTDSVFRPVYEARRKAAEGSMMEAQLTNIAMKELLGTNREMLDEATQVKLASPLRGMNPTLRRELRNRRELALAQRGACVMEGEAPVPLSEAQLADLLEAKFGKFNCNDPKSVQFARAEKMRKWLATKAQHSVIVHEMGHSFGLRHNFVSSANALTFRPQYWQLRTQDGKVTDKCLWKCTVNADCTIAGDTCKSGVCTSPELVQRETLVTEANAKECIGPRYYDPTTPTERDNLIWMWQQDSIMEYPGESTQDLLGLGVYDFAAARMFYGNTVAVFADEDVRWNPADIKSSSKARTLMGLTDTFGGIVGIGAFMKDYTNDVSQGETIHYSHLQRHLGLIKDCTPIADINVYKPKSWKVEKDGEWHPLLDGLFVAPDPSKPDQYTVCKERKVDYVPWNSLRMPEGTATSVQAWEQEVNSTKFDDYYTGGPNIDKENRLRVPYAFATDSWADLGNLSVYRHDNGADAYELFDFLITQQETQHIFNNYRRHRQSFTVRGASGRALHRYNEKMRDGAKGLTLMANVYRDFANELGYGFDDIWSFVVDRDFGPNILASAIAFDYFTRQAARPSSGAHYMNWDVRDGIARASLDAAGNPSFTIMTVPDGSYGVGGPNADPTSNSWGNVGFGGRLVENKLAPEYPYGEYNTSYTINCGSYYEKVYTAMLLTESVDNFISASRRDFIDGRYRAVSMADLFPEGYRRWLANNLTGDDFVKSPRVFAHKGRPAVELPESPTGVSKFCSSNADCDNGSKCCKNVHLAQPGDSSELAAAYDLGMCVKGTTCPRRCGNDGRTGSAADLRTTNAYCNSDANCKFGQKCNVAYGYCECDSNSQCEAGLVCLSNGLCGDPGCGEGESCCQGMCSKGKCFVDATHGLGWTTWLPAEGPKTCFWSGGSTQMPGVQGQAICSGAPVAVANTLPVDPQVGWEEQKFLIAMTMQYLPENQRTNWIDMMRLWEMGKDSDPQLGNNRIELHIPGGATYVARTYGREAIFGKTVERGIAARVLEHANELMAAAYVTTDGPDNNGDGKADWLLPALDANGQPMVRCAQGAPGTCQCSGSMTCEVFSKYTSVPAFMRQVMATYAQGDPSMRGVY